MQSEQINIFPHDTVQNKISYYHLVFFLVLLPFDRFFSEIVLLSFTLHIFINITRQKIKNAFNIQALMLASVFILNLWGLLYSRYLDDGFKDLQRMLAAALFPLLIPASGLDIKRYKNDLLKVFAISCTCAIAYLFLYALRTIAFNHLPIRNIFTVQFLNHNFSAPIGMHATYLSMYAALSLITFLYFFLTERETINKLVLLMAITLLLAGLMQLASKAVFISTAFIIAVLYPLFALQPANRKRFFLAAVLLLSIAMVGIYRVNSLKQRYIIGLKNDLTQTSINNEIMEPRIKRWTAAMELARQAPLFGYGSGSEKKILREKFFDEKLYNSYLGNLNAHNEYLSIILKTGLTGLLIWLFTLAWGFLTAWKNRDIIFASFMTIIAIVSFSENILDVNKTIFFYSFFFSLFVYASPQKIFERQAKLQPKPRPDDH